MGIDACIYVKLRDGVTEPRLEQELPQGFWLKPNQEWGMKDASHEVDNCVSFYGPCYARGPWPTLSAALMLLLNSPDVEAVWYCGDSGVAETEGPWTAEKQAEYTAYFVAHGRRANQGAKMAYNNTTAELMRENVRLRAEIKALAPDAKRYRWLRDEAPAYVVRPFADKPGGEWDTAIDAGMHARGAVGAV